MDTRKIALIDLTNKVDASYLSRVANALQVQVQRDFASEWDVTATVVAFSSIVEVPSDYWIISVEDTIDLANAYGYHWMDKAAKLPFAKILYRENWSITASHEMLEMLVNPFLNRFQATDITPELEGNEEFLVEVAGPVQDIGYGYRINEILVSNFFYPSYFDLLKTEGKKYDHLGVITEPRSILKGGYVSFLDNVGQWWQTFNIQNKLTLKKLVSGDDTSSQATDRIVRGVFWTVFVSVTFYITFKLTQHYGLRKSNHSDRGRR